MRLPRALKAVTVVIAAGAAILPGSAHASQITGQVCVNRDLPAQRLTAMFGYTSAEAGPVAVPLGGSTNRIIPSPADRGQPTVLEPGAHPFAFAVPVPSGQLIWVLDGETILAQTSSQTCTDRQPAIVGDAVVGRELVAAGGFPGSPVPKGESVTAFAYQWYWADTGDGVSSAPAVIAGADEPTYTPVAADVGHTLGVVVRALSDASDPDSIVDGVSSAATEAVVAAPAVPVRTRAPRISGTPMVGQSLTLDRGDWDGSPSLTQQWQRCLLTCLDLIGESDLTYVAKPGDVGATLRAVVSAATDAATVTETTAQTRPVVTSAIIVPEPGTTPSVSFGSVRLGTSSVRRLAVLGPGPDGVEILDVSRAGPDAADFSRAACAPRALGEGDQCVITVRFRPSAAGPKSAQIRVLTSEPGSPRTVDLTGVGVEPGAATVAPVSLSFSAAPGGPADERTVTLTNTGPVALRRGAPSLQGADGAQFTQSAGCSSTKNIAPGGTCTFTVSYAPTSAGPHVAALRIPTNRTDPLIVPLSGVAN